MDPYGYSVGAGGGGGGNQNSLVQALMSLFGQGSQEDPSNPETVRKRGMLQRDQAAKGQITPEMLQMMQQMSAQQGQRQMGGYDPKASSSMLPMMLQMFGKGGAGGGGGGGAYGTDTGLGAYGYM